MKFHGNNHFIVIEKLAPPSSVCWMHTDYRKARCQKIYNENTHQPDFWHTPPDYKCPSHSTVLWPFFLDRPGELVPEENFWTLWCKRRLTDADTPTIRLGATLSGLTSVHFHHPPIFFTGRMPILPPNQQHRSTKGN